MAGKSNKVSSQPAGGHVGRTTRSTTQAAQSKSVTATEVKFDQKTFENDLRKRSLRPRNENGRVAGTCSIISIKTEENGEDDVAETSQRQNKKRAATKQQPTPVLEGTENMEEHQPAEKRVRFSLLGLNDVADEPQGRESRFVHGNQPPSLTPSIDDKSTASNNKSELDFPKFVYVGYLSENTSTPIYAECKGREKHLETRVVYRSAKPIKYYLFNEVAVLGRYRGATKTITETRIKADLYVQWEKREARPAKAKEDAESNQRELDHVEEVVPKASDKVTINLSPPGDYPEVEEPSSEEAIWLWKTTAKTREQNKSTGALAAKPNRPSKPKNPSKPRNQSKRSRPLARSQETSIIDDFPMFSLPPWKESATQSQEQKNAARIQELETANARLLSQVQDLQRDNSNFQKTLLPPTEVVNGVTFNRAADPSTNNGLLLKQKAEREIPFQGKQWHVLKTLRLLDFAVSGTAKRVVLNKENFTKYTDVDGTEVMIADKKGHVVEYGGNQYFESFILVAHDG